MATKGKEKAKDLDLKGSSRGVWLIKVPNYLSEAWRNSTKTEMGIMRIKSGSKTDLSFDLHPEVAEEVAALQNDSSSDATSATNRTTGKSKVIPLNHKVLIQQFSNQSMYVFSEDKNDCLKAEGKVKQKAEIQPHHDSTYMELKRHQVAAAQEPKQQIQQIQGSEVNSFKPISQHKEDKEKEQQQKEVGRRARVEKEVVLDIIFSAFQSHQYYNFRDLVHKTQQPPAYLREILKEICMYRTKNPHKNMWELKPEYRHYKSKDD